MNREIDLRMFRSYLTRSYLRVNKIVTFEDLSKISIEHFLRRKGVGQTHVNSINKVLKENGYPELYFKNKRCFKINYTVDNNGNVENVCFSNIKSIEELKVLKNNIDKLLEDLK